MTRPTERDDEAEAVLEFYRQRHARAEVPCGSCTRCCRSPSIIMLLEGEGDDVESYDHEYVTLPMIDQIGPAFVELAETRGPVLRRKPNGDCVYLAEGGCSIHDRAPVVCRVFDCRDLIRKHTRAELRRHISEGHIDREIADQGRQLIRASRQR